MSGATAMAATPKHESGLPFNRREADANYQFLNGKIDGHLDVCAVRYENISQALRDSKEAIAAINNRFTAISAAIILMLIGGFGTVFWKLLDAGKNLSN